MDFGENGHAANRAAFPRGLDQPGKGYRFSMDALLLARLPLPARGRGLELGAGCGAASLGLLLGAEEPLPLVVGLDRDPAMTAMARANALKLGLADRFHVVAGDVRDPLPGGLSPQSFDFVLANPPFRAPGTGRMSPDQARRDARFETSATLYDFCRAGAVLLKTRGSLYLVHLAERLADLFAALEANGLAPKELRFVHSRAGESARLVLARAVKLGGPGATILDPLFLYQGQGADTALTPQALAFCPFLECNPQPGKANGEDHEP